MVNKIYNESNLVTMARMPDGFIDLTVTSPPYDNLRDYKGYKFPFKHIARNLFRVTKEGGVVVWIVNDATVNGSETGTSFRQALFFMECGFRLHDTMIWEKESFRSPESNRYQPVFEYMFVFSKGKPKTFNSIKDRKNKYEGRIVHGTQRMPDGSLRPCNTNKKKRALLEFGARHNVWKVNSDRQNLGHPAPFSEVIAHDHILTWSNEGEIVYDPFGGSGTTAKMAHLLKRKWLISEISKEYCKISNSRIVTLVSNPQLF